VADRESIDSSQIAELVRSALADRDDLVALYLFGSVATGVVHALSDVDVAVLLAGDLDEDELFVRGLEIGALLETALRSIGRPIDLVVLNRAAPALVFQVFKTGRLLLDRDPDARSLFVMRTLSRYYDGQRYREYHAEQLLARIRREGLGRGYRGDRNALAEARRLSARLASVSRRNPG